MERTQKKGKYIFFTFYHVCASVARKLIEEGNTVIYAEIQDISELKNNGKEDDDKKKERLSFYDGLIQKHDAVKVLKMMKNIKNKDEWFEIGRASCRERVSSPV